METVMMFNATFNNISVISWRSVLVEETGVPGENHRPITNTNQVSPSREATDLSAFEIRPHKMGGLS